MPTSIPTREQVSLSKLEKIGIGTGYLVIIAIVFGLAAFDAGVVIRIADAANSDFNQADFASEPSVLQLAANARK